MAVKRGVVAEDLYRLKSVVNPQFSPDGQSFVYVQTTIDQEEEEYRSHLFFQTVDSHDGPSQWTYGKGKNHTPRWSPNGTEVAFVSNRSGKNQLYVLSVKGGEARQVTDVSGGANSPVWSPDGTKIAFTTSLSPNQSIFEKEEEKKQEKLRPLEVAKMKYKSDAEGLWKGHYKQTAVVDVKTGELTQLTFGLYDVTLYGWSPDGKFLAVGTNATEQDDLAFNKDVYLLDIESKVFTLITDGKGEFGSASWSPDGRYLAMFGHNREFEDATYPKIWLYETAGHTLSCLAPEWDGLPGDYMVGDFHQGAVSPGILWASDSKGFYFVGTDHGSVNIYFGNLSGEIRPVYVGEQHVYGLSIHSDSQKALAAISKPDQIGDIYLLSLTGDGTFEKMTNVNGPALNELLLSKPETFQYKGAKGWDIQGWLIKPVGLEEGKKYPLILEIHGGPHVMYGNTYMNEFQILAGKGYAVLYVNPRGSHGYSQEFVNAVRGDYGGGDYQDIMLAVDYVLNQYDFIDETRLGVTGGSYGGFMTNWIVSHSNQFKAAVTQRSISNWISMYGVSDIGYYFLEWEIGADLNDFETLWKHSPLAYIKNIETPLLILHSERDYRCPIEQAEQLFIGLKRLGRETKFVRFPEANHELSRSGKPNLRRDRLNYIVEWFEEHI